MMMNDLDGDQLGAIAYVIAKQRAATGTPWDRPGIAAILRKLLCLPGAALDAGLAAAQDPAAATPGAIAWPQYWPRHQTPPEVNERRCEICSRTETTCRRIHDSEVANGVPDPHEFVA